MSQSGRAREEVSAVQAACTTLRALDPLQTNALDARFTESLAKIRGSGESIERGRAWGECVANQILPLRSEPVLVVFLLARGERYDLQSPSPQLLESGAGGGTRTRTAFYGPGILSPVRLPFRHTGMPFNQRLMNRF